LELPLPLLACRPGTFNGVLEDETRWWLKGREVVGSFRHDGVQRKDRGGAERDRRPTLNEDMPIRA
jgi:hypothetical protein